MGLNVLVLLSFSGFESSGGEEANKGDKRNSLFQQTFPGHRAARPQAVLSSDFSCFNHDFPSCESNLETFRC